MAKPLSWKWKIAIALVCFILFSIGFVFTPSGHTWMLGQIMTEYNALPASERRDSALADKYMSLAYFRANVCLDSSTAMEMYKDFCGFRYKGQRGSEYGMKVMNTGKLEGICSPDGKTGWGPMHPRAPEAFFNYIQLYDPTHSNQAMKLEIENYHRLFYVWCKTWGPDHKPHPLYMKYWPKLSEMAARTGFQFQDPAGVIAAANSAPKYDPAKDPTLAEK